MNRISAVSTDVTVGGATVHDGADGSTVEAMFAITETAVLAINALFSEIPEGAGLRIAYLEGSQRPQLSVALARSEQDTVVESAGVPVFLAPSVAQTLDDKVLDVHRVVNDDGDLYHFAIVAQAAGRFI